MSNPDWVPVRWVSTRYCQRSVTTAHGVPCAPGLSSLYLCPPDTSHISSLGAKSPNISRCATRKDTVCDTGRTGERGTWSTGPVTRWNFLFKKQCQNLTRIRCCSSSMQRSQQGVKKLLAELWEQLTTRGCSEDSSLQEVWAKLNFS